MLLRFMLCRVAQIKVFLKVIDFNETLKVWNAVINDLILLFDFSGEIDNDSNIHLIIYRNGKSW